MSRRMQAWEYDLKRRIYVAGDFIVAHDKSLYFDELPKVNGIHVVPDTIFHMHELDPTSPEEEEYLIRKIARLYNSDAVRDLDYILKLIEEMRRFSIEMGEEKFGIPRENATNPYAEDRIFDPSQRQENLRNELHAQAVLVPEAAVLIKAIDNFRIIGVHEKPYKLMPGSSETANGWQIGNSIILGKPHRQDIMTHECVHAFDWSTDIDNPKNRISLKIDGRSIEQDVSNLLKAIKSGISGNSTSFELVIWRNLAELVVPGDFDARQLLLELSRRILYGIKLDSPLYDEAKKSAEAGNFWSTKTEHLAYYADCFRGVDNVGNHLDPDPNVVELFRMIAPGMTDFYVKQYLPLLREKMREFDIRMDRWMQNSRPGKIADDAAAASERRTFGQNIFD